MIDSSALIAILKDEPEAEIFATAIENDSTRLLSAASFLEVVMVIEGRYGEKGGRAVDELLATAEIKIILV